MSFESLLTSTFSAPSLEKNTITFEKLRHEMAAKIMKLGRVSLIDFANITRVDFYHVEKQVQSTYGL